MAIVELETFLPTDTAIVWDHMLQSRLLRYVAKGVLTFRPVDPDRFPECWKDGPYRVQKYLWGFLPLGWQVIDMELMPDRGQVHRLRDNGRGWLVPTWDHTMEVEPIEGGTRYIDRVKIDAGVLTPLVTPFAKFFFKHRQKRWQKLVAANFDYSIS